MTDSVARAASETVPAPPEIPHAFAITPENPAKMGLSGVFVSETVQELMGFWQGHTEGRSPEILNPVIRWIGFRQIDELAQGRPAHARIDQTALRCGDSRLLR